MGLEIARNIYLRRGLKFHSTSSDKSSINTAFQYEVSSYVDH